MMQSSSASPGSRPQAEGKVKSRRAGKTCPHCHARKIRCDVQQVGVPCSNCVDRSLDCRVRRRKNARAVPRSAPLYQQPVQSAGARQAVNRPDSEQDKNRISSPQVEASPSSLVELRRNEKPHGDQGGDSIGGAVVDDNTDRDTLMSDSYWADGINNFNNFLDLEDVFAFTDWRLLPTTQPPLDGRVHPDLPFAQAGVNQPASTNDVQNPMRVNSIARAKSAVIQDADRQFLESQGCFDVPPLVILREIMRYYFQFIHPNVPIIDEYRFDHIWTQEDFRLNGFSFVVFRAMLFAAVHFLSVGSVSVLGYMTSREARLGYYRSAKLLFDFGCETDPLANAQACLLLTYYAPSYNRLRVNSYWLLNAARFARVAHAHEFHLTQNAETARILKRLWWAVLFRDRVLSLGLRWTSQIELNPTFKSKQHFLNSGDFASDLGKSRVHDRSTQLRIVDIITSTCSLVCELTPAIQVLYQHEKVIDRMNNVAKAVPGTIAEVERCLQALRQWQKQTMIIFPAPVGLDDTHEAVCIFANLMFYYCSSAVFALCFLSVLIYEMIPHSRNLISLEDCQEGSVLAVEDLERRTQELVQARLTRYLPISVSAFGALPLLLQAINVAAVRGTETEAIEARKLIVFTRILDNQKENFDGSDFCSEILSNIVAYVQNDERSTDWLANWYDGRDQSAQSTGAGNAAGRWSTVKLNWKTLMRKQPRVYLRLLLRLDCALCNGSALNEEDLPNELLRTGPGYP